MVSTVVLDGTLGARRGWEGTDGRADGRGAGGRRLPARLHLARGAGARDRQVVAAGALGPGRVPPPVRGAPPPDRGGQREDARPEPAGAGARRLGAPRGPLDHPPARGVPADRGRQRTRATPARADPVRRGPDARGRGGPGRCGRGARGALTAEPPDAPACHWNRTRVRHTVASTGPVLVHRCARSAETVRPPP